MFNNNIPTTPQEFSRHMFEVSSIEFENFDLPPEDIKVKTEKKVISSSSRTPNQSVEVLKNIDALCAHFQTSCALGIEERDSEGTLLTEENVVEKKVWDYFKGRERCQCLMIGCVNADGTQRRFPSRAELYWVRTL